MLQIPVIKPKTLKRMLAAGMGPRPPLLGGTPCTPTTDDSLEVFMQRVGTLLGRDPSKWEQTGEAAWLVGVPHCRSPPCFLKAAPSRESACAAAA